MQLSIFQQLALLLVVILFTDSITYGQQDTEAVADNIPEKTAVVGSWVFHNNGIHFYNPVTSELCRTIEHENFRDFNHVPAALYIVPMESVKFVEGPCVLPVPPTLAMVVHQLTSLDMNPLLAIYPINNGFKPII